MYLVFLEIVDFMVVVLLRENLEDNIVIVEGVE